MKNLILISIVATAAVLGGCQHNPEMRRAIGAALTGGAHVMQQQQWQQQQWRAANPVQQPVRLKTNCRWMQHQRYWHCN